MLVEKYHCAGSAFQIFNFCPAFIACGLLRLDAVFNVNQQRHCLLYTSSLAVFSPVTALIALAAAVLSFLGLLVISHYSAKNAPVEAAANRDMTGAILEYARGLAAVSYTHLFFSSCPIRISSPARCSRI